MTYLGELISTDKERGRDTYLTAWFSKDSSNELKVAALGYLGEFGRREDLVAIRTEFDTGNHQTTYAAVDAILQINLRNNHEHAIRTLIELQPESIRDPLLEVLFDNSPSIETGLLTECVSHRNAKVRRVAASLLRQRGAIDIDTANRLILDPDPDVRLEGLDFLVDAGRTVSDEEAKGILIKPAASFGLLAGTDHPGEHNWRRWRRERLAQMQLTDLERAASSEWILDRTAHFVWASRRFSEQGQKLRQCIDDCYKPEFETEIGELEKKGVDKETIEKIRSLEESIRKERTRDGLDVVCQHGGMADLPLVRRALASGFVNLSNLDLTFIQKYGAWQDIKAIISTPRHYGSIGLLFSYRGEGVKDFDIAKTIYKLGHQRLEELCCMDIPDRILSIILGMSSNTDLKKLDDHLLLRFLHSGTEILRKIVALKSVALLPKARLRGLLSAYTADFSYFYDVVHLLDFGISVPKEKGVVAAKRAITRELRRSF